MMNKIKIDQEKFDEKLYNTAEKLHPFKKPLKEGMKYLAVIAVSAGAKKGVKVLEKKFH